MMQKLKFIFSLIVILSFTSCEKYFGDKTDLDFIEIPEFQNRSIAYVPIQPAFTGFANPSDVQAGYDELIYVVDKGRQEIVAFDQSGRELGRKSVPGVTKMIQTRTLDILAIGTYDTTIQDSTYSLSTIYRLDLNQAQYGIEGAEITNRIIQPFYYKTSFGGNDAETKFTGLSLISDGKYFVTRNGPGRNFIGPNDAVLLFDTKDEFVTPISITYADGSRRSDHFQQPISITGVAQPPQNFLVDDNRNFFVAMENPSSALQVQSITYTETDFGSSYEVADLESADTSRADDFLYRPFRWSEPVGMTLTGDGTNYLFVVDSKKDSLYQFTARGLEGVQPPPGSSSNKNILASFGGTGAGFTEFNNPVAVAYLDQIVYVADAGNQRILRFRLTTDFD